MPKQASPDGLAQAFVTGADFIGAGSVCLVLGDNIFYGDSLGAMWQAAASEESGATILGYYVKEPQRYGVAELKERGEVVGIEAKSEQPKSHYAVAGLYFYDNQVIENRSRLGTVGPRRI